MKKIYVVMSEELLGYGDLHTETCRAFGTAKDARAFKVQLQELYREDNGSDNVTKFYVKAVPFGGL